MSVEKITKVVNRCVCELPDCIGKGRPWDSKDEKIPKRCSWCKRTGWNGQDRRRKDGQYEWVRVRQCSTCGGTQWIQNAEGIEVCAHCSAAALQPSPAAAPAKKTAAAHTPGCKCTLCQIKRAKKSKPAVVKLPKPRKVKRIEE
jgi:hypothetical protein